MKKPHPLVRRRNTESFDPALNPKFANIPVEAEQPTQTERAGHAAWEIGKTISIIVLAALFIRALIVQPYYVDGQSMQPTFHQDDYLLVNQFLYRVSAPQRGDVIVFKAPPEPDANYIKRIIGIPGDRVQLKDGHYLVANAKHPAGVVVTEPYIEQGIPTLPESDQTTWQLGPGEYFVSGDNRQPAKSSDSRAWGTVPRKSIIGKVDLRVYPLHSLGGIKHQAHPELGWAEGATLRATA